MTALGLKSGCYWRVVAERMRPARLAETSYQHGIGSFQIHDSGWNQPPHRFQNAGKAFEFRSFADIDHQRRAAVFARLHGQLSKIRDQFDGKIVDAIVAQVLEGLEHRSLTRPAHAGNDYKFWRMLSLGGTRLAFRRGGSACGPWRVRFANGHRMDITSKASKMARTKTGCDYQARYVL